MAVEKMPVAKPKKVMLTIQSSEDDKTDVTLVHNHRDIHIQRDQAVEVEECFLEVLKHSVIETKVKVDGQEKLVRIPRYSYSVEQI